MDERSDAGSITNQYLHAIRAAFPTPSAVLARYLNVALSEDLEARQEAWEALTDVERETIRGIAERIRHGAGTNGAAGEGG